VTALPGQLPIIVENQLNFRPNAAGLEEEIEPLKTSNAKKKLSPKNVKCGGL
jgi:hypothetical protein